MTKIFPDSKVETSLVRVLSISSLVNDEIVENELENGQDTSPVDICNLEEEGQSLSLQSATKKFTRDDIALKPQADEKSSEDVPRLVIFTVPQDPINQNQQFDHNPELDLDF